MELLAAASLAKSLSSSALVNQQVMSNQHPSFVQPNPSPLNSSSRHVFPNQSANEFFITHRPDSLGGVQPAFALSSINQSASTSTSPRSQSAKGGDERAVSPPNLSISEDGDGISSSTATPVAAVNFDKAYTVQPMVRNVPENNVCRMKDYRGTKVATFDVDGCELICLPQAFDLFLKHLVGGLHTVYTKLKRLNVTPVVCNVEQVRVLRGLGAIQPGVNRCKLISCADFDLLYDDCTNSTARPGRPPKRASPGGGSSPGSGHYARKKPKLESGGGDMFGSGGQPSFGAGRFFDMMPKPPFPPGYPAAAAMAPHLPVMPFHHPFIPPSLTAMMASQLGTQLNPQLASQLSAQMGSQLNTRINTQLAQQINSQLISQLAAAAAVGTPHAGFLTPDAVGGSVIRERLAEMENHESRSNYVAARQAAAPADAEPLALLTHSRRSPPESPVSERSTSPHQRQPTAARSASPPQLTSSNENHADESGPNGSGAASSNSNNDMSPKNDSGLSTKSSSNNNNNSRNHDSNNGQTQSDGDKQWIHHLFLSLRFISNQLTELHSAQVAQAAAQIAKESLARKRLQFTLQRCRLRISLLQLELTKSKKSLRNLRRMFSMAKQNGV